MGMSPTARLPVIGVRGTDNAAAGLGGMVLQVEELAITPDDGKVISLTLDHLLPLPGPDADVEVGFDFVKVTRPARRGVEAYERHHHLMPPGEADAGADVPTLEQLDIYNVADLDHDRLLREQIVRDDYRVIAVAGFAPFAAGYPTRRSTSRAAQPRQLHRAPRHDRRHRVA